MEKRKVLDKLFGFPIPFLDQVITFDEFLLFIISVVLIGEIIVYVLAKILGF